MCGLGGPYLLTGWEKSEAVTCGRMTDTKEEEARKATDGSCSEAAADGAPQGQLC